MHSAEMTPFGFMPMTTAAWHGSSLRLSAKGSDSLVSSAMGGMEELGAYPIPTAVKLNARGAGL